MQRRRDMTETPTSYPEINAVLADLLSRVQDELAELFVGLYLHGSLAIGGFDPLRSDIDFLVVTASELPADVLPVLAGMHARLSASGSAWATRLEGSYISQEELRRYDAARADHPALRVDGSFDVDHHGYDWVIQRHVIRERGITLCGPPTSSLIDPLRPEELRRAAAATLREWWAPMLEDAVRLHRREYQAYAVTTMCRALYTLHHGDVVSKPDAARWAQGEVAEQEAELISEALAWPRAPQADRLSETLAFVRRTLEVVQELGL